MCGLISGMQSGDTLHALLCARVCGCDLSHSCAVTGHRPSERGDTVIVCAAGGEAGLSQLPVVSACAPVAGAACVVGAAVILLDSVTA